MGGHCTRLAIYLACYVQCLGLAARGSFPLGVEAQGAMGRPVCFPLRAQFLLPGSKCGLAKWLQEQGFGKLCCLFF